MSSALSNATEEPKFAYAPGDIIAGKYALEEMLGLGGMGAVFRARNTAIDMPVAIKLIRADLDRELLSGRLLQEARAAAKLAHPAIVRVFDVGQTALGDPFIVMELLHGESLATVIQREGRINSARAVQLLLPIADALAVAHAKGFVHRDVKPDNVFIANDEEGQLQPKLVDFGIVKQEYAAGDSQLTQVGAVLGSPDYMSPEQARGLDGIDLRSDVWSFSIVLYETITGQTPFESQNYNALLRAIVESEAPSLRDRSAADPELSAIVEHGMKKDPAARFATMGQMGKALATWLSEQGITEDACGVSLEARWLSRSTDPTFAGRVSRTSSPDSWPEPPSGIRAISSKLGNAPTVEVEKSAGTPAPVAGTQPLLSTSKRQSVLLAAGALVLAAAALGWFALRGSSAHVQPASPATAQATEARPEPVVKVAPSPTPAAEVVTTPAVIAPLVLATEAEKPAARPSAPKAKTPAQTPAPAQSAPAPAPGAAVPPKAPAPPASDLLSPY
jgi:serine/threonine protein kinase